MKDTIEIELNKWPEIPIKIVCLFFVEFFWIVKTRHTSLLLSKNGLETLKILNLESDAIVILLLGGKKNPKIK